MRTLSNMMLIAAIGMFLTSVAEAQQPGPPAPPAPDQAAALPWDCPNQGMPPGLGPPWAPGPDDQQAFGRRMGPGGRGHGAGLGQQGWSGPMADRQRAFAGARQGWGVQGQRGGRAGRGAAMGRGGGGKGAFGRQQMGPAMRGMRPGRGGQQFGPGAQFGRGSGFGMGRGSGICDGSRKGQRMRQFAPQGRRGQSGPAWNAGQGQGRQFAPQWNVGQRRMGRQQGMRGGRDAGRALNPLRQQRRDGSCFDEGAAQNLERLQQRIERLQAQLEQLERDLTAAQP